MTQVAAESLQELPTEEACECLPGKIWQTFLSVQALAVFALSLAWLIQAAQVAAPAAAWWKSALAVVGVTAYGYLLCAARRLDPHSRQGWSFFDIAALLAGALMTTVFVMRSGVLLGAALIAMCLVLEGAALWRLKLVPVQWIGRLRNRRAAVAAVENEVAPIYPIASGELRSTALESPNDVDPAISQQLTRRETESGEEISGFVRGEFASGEASASVDIAFCPTLHGTPELDYEAICDGEVEVTVATLKPFGARLELKRRGELADPLLFTLELHATCGRESEDEAVAIREPIDS